MAVSAAAKLLRTTKVLIRKAWKLAAPLPARQARA
jgi:hypothetical protein